MLKNLTNAQDVILNRENTVSLLIKIPKRLLTNLMFSLRNIDRELREFSLPIPLQILPDLQDNMYAMAERNRQRKIKSERKLTKSDYQRYCLLIFTSFLCHRTSS